MNPPTFPRLLMMAKAAACDSPAISPSHMVALGPWSAQLPAVATTSATIASPLWPDCASGPSAASAHAAVVSGTTACHRTSRVRRLCQAFHVSATDATAYGTIDSPITFGSTLRPRAAPPCTISRTSSGPQKRIP